MQQDDYATVPTRMQKFDKAEGGIITYPCSLTDEDIGQDTIEMRGSASPIGPPPFREAKTPKDNLWLVPEAPSALIGILFA